MNDLKILSLGAGVQSSALALMIAHGEIEMVDAAIFADTGAEPQAVYDWLDWLEKQLPFPVYRVMEKQGLTPSALNVMVSRTTGKHYFKTAIPMRSQKADGSAPPLTRQCTTDFKIIPIYRKVRDLLAKKQRCLMMIGISVDEVTRMKPARVKFVTNTWPLVDKRLSRNSCVQWMKRHGYPVAPRSACVYCPYHSDKWWRQLKTEDSVSFASAVAFEAEFHKRFDAIPSGKAAFRYKSFLHKSLVPLAEVNFDPPSDQTSFLKEMDDECEGLCGV